MDTLTFPLPNQLFVVIAPHAARSRMLDLAAQLALRGAVRILDAGNQSNVYPIAQRLRRSTVDVNAALRRIQVQRAFTCYQVAALLVEAQPAPTVTLVLDFLSTFYDQDVKLLEATQLLRGCLKDLQRLAEHTPVLVSARPPVAACVERMPLLDLLRESAAQLWETEPEQDLAVMPPSLPLIGDGGPPSPTGGPGKSGSGGKPSLTGGPGKSGSGGKPSLTGGPGKSGSGGKPSPTGGPDEAGSGGKPSLTGGPGKSGSGGKPSLTSGPDETGRGG